MVKDNRQGGVMQDKEIRLECLKLAMEAKAPLNGTLRIAESLYKFVASGVIELPPQPKNKEEIKKVAPKLIDATKRFKRLS